MRASLPRMIAAAFVTGAMALAAAPARSADTASPNDTARFLAGLPPAPDSPLTALAATPLWQQHARRFDTLFGHEDATSLSKVRAFSQAHLKDPQQTLLYMFSGPDFLYATSFFPNASSYVLAGLEPVGDVPQLTALRRGALDGALHNLDHSLASLLSYSFFITKNMKTQLSTGPVYGTLPILYVFLARTGKTVHEVSFVNLDAEGNVVTAEPVEGSTGKLHRTAQRASGSSSSGVKIVFSDGSHPNQTLYYFSTNLADEGVKRSGFLAFCTKLGPADSFIKSASYLMHGGSFTRVRSFLLDQSAAVLQDDSGIPLAYFDPKKWRLQPFGRYVGPLSIFGHSYQPRMATLFRNGNSPALDFGIGYRWRRNESNLLLASKSAVATSGNELTPPSPSDQYAPGAETKPPGNAPAPGKTASGKSSRRKHVDNGKGALGCQYGGIFPFCSPPPPKQSR